MTFLKADPEGKGSIQDQVTAEMTTELMKVMGIAGRQSAAGSETHSRLRRQRAEVARSGHFDGSTIYISLLFPVRVSVRFGARRWKFSARPTADGKAKAAGVAERSRRLRA